MKIVLCTWIDRRRNVNLDAFRVHVNQLFGEKPSPHKLRAGLSTHPGLVRWMGYAFKVISASEAKCLREGSIRPHRIFVWCEKCHKWQYAGKFAQHLRAKDHQVKVAA